jgi:hypothetical protein
VTSTNRAIWRDAAAAWSSAAALTFVESTGGGNYIYVQNSDGNSSYVGMIGGSQAMNIYNWNYKYIVAHEIGHALGLKHEHSRPDRDTYVVIYFNNVEAGVEGNFQKDTTAQTYGQYDFDSVMHYPRDAFSRNDSNTIEPTSPYSSYLNVIGQRTHLSSLDLSGMAQRYGGGSSGPSNNNFAGRRVISGTQGNVTGTNVGATKEPAEPSFLASTGGKSVWYSWTAPASGNATIDTQQSNFDTILAVYTGSSLSSLGVIATNDDSSTNRQSRVTFTATAGTVYQIAVDGYSAASGNIRLNWALTGITSTPANNNFASRRAFSGFGGTVSGSNGGATKESGEPMHAQNQGGRSVWYSWTAPGTGAATFDTGESNFDTLLAVYTGPSVNALTHVASNDDSQEGLTSSVTFPATAGVNYKIAVDGYLGDSGSIRLRWALSAPSTKPDFNRDGRSDYVLYHAGTHRTALWYLDDNLFLGSGWGPTLPAGWRLVHVADFDGDGGADYLLFQPTTRKTAIWYMSGPTFRAGLYGPAIPSGYEVIGAADFNGDGKPDYILYNAATLRTALWYLDNNLFVGSDWGPTIAAGWNLIGVADFDGDGNSDYLLLHPSARQTAIWYMSGSTFRAGLYGPIIAQGYELVGTSDFNGDSKPDYVLYDASAQRTALWYLNNNIYNGAKWGPTLPSGYILAAP